MNLPFLRYFKKGKATDEGNVAVAPRPIVPLEKPASERFGKTVMPNTSRVVGVDPVDHFPLVPPIGNPPPAMPAPPSEPARISLGEDGAVRAIRPRALAGKRETPAAERTITLRLADLVPHLPEGILPSGEADPEQRLLLKAAEVERGMAKGRPTVSLRSIYQQAPAAFASAVGEEDEREVALPFGKVLEQFAAFQVRPDQVVEREVAQLETPFLKMTQADSERLGTPSAPVPPPASSVSFAAELLDPEPVAPPVLSPVAAAAPPAPKTMRSLRLPLPDESASPADPAPSAPAASPTHPDVPARPPLSLQPKISSNGTGGPASERVPASSGSPVPTPLPSPFAPPPAASPVRLPFKVTPPCNDLRPASPPEAVAPPVLQAKTPVAEGPRIRLPLLSVLRDISPFQLSAPTDAIPATAELEIPFSIVQPQLSLGRIAISPAQFEAGLPEEYRTLLKLEDGEVPVALPLQEVLAHLPNENLQLRPDQEVPELGEMFETPFSAKAAEDAVRLKESSAKPARVAKDVGVVAGGVDPGRASSTEDNKVNDIALPGSPTPATKGRPRERSPLQEAFDTDEVLDAKAVAALASKLPGVNACAIVFSDGLSLAGDIPAEYGAEGLCALAPSIMRRVDEQMTGTQLGVLTGITLFCSKRPISFFSHGNICLAALHGGGELSAEIRARLHTAVQELARIYAASA